MRASRAPARRSQPSAAAYWAISDRQAALILLVTVQQGLTTPEQLLAATRRTLGSRRRAFVRSVVRDIALGVQSLAELDFAVLCRERGLPEPDRQELVETDNGRIYLDVRWSNGLVRRDRRRPTPRRPHGLDGQPSQQRPGLEEDRALRIDLVGLRVFTDAFLAQVARGHAQLGWTAA